MAVGLLVLQADGPALESWTDLALFALVAAICAPRTISFADRVGNVSVGFVLVFAAMVRFGATAAVVSALVAGVAATLFQSKRAFPRTWVVLFNASVLVISAWLAWRVYVAAGGECPPTNLRTVWLAATLAAATYYASNALLVVLAAAVAEATNPLSVLRDSVLWMGPIYLAGASLGVLIAESHRVAGPGVFAAIVPLLWVVHQAFKNHIEKLRAELDCAREQRRRADQAATAYRRTVESLAATVDARDPHTHGHTRRVQRLAAALAEAMGCDAQLAETVHTGALLHDVGKIGIPDQVLTKDGRLTEEEFAVVRTHASLGADIVARAEFDGAVAAVVRHHHERWDGSGYPGGLVGEETPLAARIVAVADVYDALTSDRPYRRAWPETEAVRYIIQNAARRYDPRACEALPAALARLNEEEPSWHGEGLRSTGPAKARTARGRVLSAQTRPGTMVEPPPEGEGRTEAIRDMASRLHGVLEVELGALFLVDRSLGELSSRALFGRRRAALEALHIPLGAGVTGAAAEAGFPIYDAPAETDLLMSGVNGELADVALAAAVPILGRSGDALGAITVYRDTPLRPEEKSLLLRAAAEAAAAMEALPTAVHSLSVGPAQPNARTA